MRNKDIKKLFNDKSFVEKYAKAYGDCMNLAFKVDPNSRHGGLRYVEITSKAIFTNEGKLKCWCNGYYYEIEAKWLEKVVPYDEYEKSCYFHECFLNGNSFSRFKD